MLKGIHPAISPELLKTLAEMRHGDEIILSDAHFPTHLLHSNVSLRMASPLLRYLKVLRSF
ncbi:L-fucose mutarotase [Haemophilus parainfluenzae]|uniref:L-fucose mutarotase n=1 Tax=Haemophilus parainfluenzae TaxID=729 RepID=A0A377JI53_HAEPA|nr:L-fucose mutarotase [Haemophilus parainfluenzae]